MTAGLPLVGTPFQDLLPASIKDDPQIAAAAQALDGVLAEANADIGLVLIWARIDELEEPLLSNLAYQLHLEGYEGWHLAETLEQKRRLVRDSIILHFHKGTRYSLERVFELLDMRGLVTEWWESDEPIEDFPPYTFDIDIEVTRSVGEQFYHDAMMLVFALKNLRSHLRKLRITLAARGKVPVVASALIGGSEVSIYPFRAVDITMRHHVPIVAAACQSAHEITIHPLRSKFFWDDGNGNIRMSGRILDGSTDPLFYLDRDGNMRLKDSAPSGTSNGFMELDGDGDVKLKG